MVYAIAQHIITPLSDTIDGNIEAICDKRHLITHHTSIRNQSLVQPITASFFESLSIVSHYTIFESLCIQAIQATISSQSVDLTSSRCVFILSSTKGDIWTPMAQTCQNIAHYFGNNTPAIVVSTACTSGATAQLTAYRLLKAGTYDTAVVVGCDIQCEFIVSGFQSCQAVSEYPCRPFDKNRDGLNPGEAVAVLIMSNQRPCTHQVWCMLGGSIHNDANHISGPSRTGEGSFRCLTNTLQLTEKENIATISVHGTATIYNDEMESIALHRAGFQDIPITALKGYYGHTMGAAGLLETILTMHALENGIILPAIGYEEQGTSYPINLSNAIRSAHSSTFIKLLSGFGGVNAAVTWSLDETDKQQIHTSAWQPIDEIRLSSSENIDLLYRNKINDYPKYFKMDKLCRLAFVSTELLIQKIKDKNSDFQINSENCCVIFANKTASIHNDTDYQQTIIDKNNYYPSPSLFVYTLPNIMTGEIAIRHHIYGETACYVLHKEDDLQNIVNATLQLSPYDQALIGWIEYPDNNNFEAHLYFLTKKKTWTN